MLADLFATGRILDVVLVVLAVGGLALWLLWSRSGRGLPPGDVLPFLLSGACLTAAFRATTLGSAWQWSAGLLALAFGVHLFELAGRWRTRG